MEQIAPLSRRQPPAEYTLGNVAGKLFGLGGGLLQAHGARRNAENSVNPLSIDRLVPVADFPGDGHHRQPVPFGHAGNAHRYFAAGGLAVYAAFPGKDQVGTVELRRQAGGFDNHLYARFHFSSQESDDPGA